jgi:hypothetical protein
MQRSIFALAFVLGCSAANNVPMMTGPTPLRPGIKDSSKAYQGTPSAHEVAFWQAVRTGDDAARATAVAQLKSDVAADPTNGYSAFLAGASSFIASSDLLRALAAGQVPTQPARQLPSDTGPLLQEGLDHLTDPLYVGFSATLLAGVQAISGDLASAAKSQQIAVANNIPASSVGQINFALSMGDIDGALASAYKLADYCNGTPLDHTNPDVNAYVDKANAAGLVHRECYSGYYAMHGTEGELLFIADVLALKGNAALAQRYYDGLRRATNYGTWPLRPLVERLASGAQSVTQDELRATISCPVCHVNELQ